MFISLIVPFKNGAQFAKRFAEGVNSQELSVDCYELILISNLSEDNTEELLDKYLRKNINYSILKFNNKPSSYAARNYGSKQANGDLLVFTDIDCKLTPTYLMNIINFFETSSYAAMSGKVTLEIIDTKNYWEIYDASCNLDNQMLAKQNHLVTANFAIKKELFIKTGFFDEFVSNGDSMYGERLYKIGIGFKYNEGAEIIHPTRKSYSAVEKKLLRMAYGQGQAYYNAKRKYLFGVIIYFFKAFNVANLKRIWNRMKSVISLECFLIFALQFTKIRLKQVIAFSNGYRDISLQKYNH